MGSRWRSRDGNYWHPLREGTSHTIDRAQFADTLGCSERSEAPNTGIAIGGISSVEFVAGTNILQVAGHDLIEKSQNKISWNTEEMLHS